MLKGRMREEEEEESEVSLELSIGGNYGKSKGMGMGMEKRRKVGFCLEMEEEEEERVKKKLVNSDSCNDGLDNKQIRSREKEIEPAAKKGRFTSSNAMVSPVNGLVSYNFGGNGTETDHEDKGDHKMGVFRMNACRSYGPFPTTQKLKFNEEEMGAGGMENGKGYSDGGSGSGSPGGCSSSGFSNNQCTSALGGSYTTTDESGSNSSHSQLDQQLLTSSAASHNNPDQTEMTESTTPKFPSSCVCKSTLVKPSESNGLTQNLPAKPENVNPHPYHLTKMPCVSTTGNGPNGKTVNGFLYKYAKGGEVSIVCVCHGCSFSPAGFVEHAGGVDIVHPLRHITIFPIGFGCK